MTSINSRGPSVHNRLNGDATVLKRVFRDNFVIFRHSDFFYVCLYANFQFL